MVPVRTADAFLIDPRPRVLLRQHWRCTVTVPIVTPPGLHVVEGESYEEWEERPINFYFRGKNRSCHSPRAQLNRNLTENLMGRIPGVLVSHNHSPSPEEYFRELRAAKFCLVFACDDPQTSRFADALAAGCIPIVINDHFRLYVAPFVRLLNYDAMMITISEADWRASRGTYFPSPLLLQSGTAHKRALRDLHAGLMEMRRALLWHHPRSLVATMALRTVQHECLSSHVRTPLAADAVTTAAARARARASRPY